MWVPERAQYDHRRRGVTLIEVLLVVIIMGIAATMAADAMADTDAGLRANRAARECLTAIRAARTLSLSSGRVCGVRFDATAKTFHVFSNNTPDTPAANSLAPSGTYLVNLSTSPELAGVSMAVTLANDASSPFDLQFTPLGATLNSGTITFSFAGKSARVIVPNVGDPTVN